MTKNTLASLFALLAVILNMSRMRLGHDPTKRSSPTYRLLRTFALIAILIAIALISFGQYLDLE